jgi:hypothetical protein
MKQDYCVKCGVWKIIVAVHHCGSCYDAFLERASGTASASASASDEK